MKVFYLIFLLFILFHSSVLAYAPSYELTVDNETVYLNQSEVQNALNLKDTQFEVVTDILNNNILDRNHQIEVLEKKVNRMMYGAILMALIFILIIYCFNDEKSHNNQQAKRA